LKARFTRSAICPEILDSGCRGVEKIISMVIQGEFKLINHEDELLRK
jgi:hypothetical protein